MANLKWAFKAKFRTKTFAWNGTAKASQRMREAVSEIKKVAKKDTASAADGVIELFARIYPACMQIDSSSGALTTAVNNTIESLLPIIIAADWDIDTRHNKLETLYQVMMDDGWNSLNLAEASWGELCVYPELANEWVERLYKHIEAAWSKNDIFGGTEICLSSLLFAERFEELEKLLAVKKRRHWHDYKYLAAAFVKMGKPNQAIEIAESCISDRTYDMERYEIYAFCENLLISLGHSEKAYAKYALKIPFRGVYNNIFRDISKRYPSKPKREILLDLIDKTGNAGKWFASAKAAGELDIALQCAETGNCDTSVLLRATRDFSKSNPDFACKVGIEALISLLTKEFYDRIEPVDIKIAYDNISAVAKDADVEDWFKEAILRRILNIQPKIKSYLIDTILGLVKGFDS